VSADVKPRRFPPPWTVEDHNDACFIVKDRNGFALSYVYYEEERGRRSAANLDGPKLASGKPAALISCAAYSSEPRSHQRKVEDSHGTRRSNFPALRLLDGGGHVSC
jgi:hypothetical protein